MRIFELSVLPQQRDLAVNKNRRVYKSDPHMMPAILVSSESRVNTIEPLVYEIFIGLAPLI
jgi:hypothetical protein